MSLQLPPLPELGPLLFKEREAYFRFKRHLDCAIEHARLAGFMVGPYDSNHNCIQPHLAQVKRALGLLKECREKLVD